jgi:hypothetical protein
MRENYRCGRADEGLFLGEPEENLVKMSDSCPRSRRSSGSI